MWSLLAVAGLCGVAAAAEYGHREAFVGQDFFETFRWDFHTGEDPTHGTVDYVGYSAAASRGLVNASSDRVYMGADHKTTIDRAMMQDGGLRGRPSVRIMSRQGYNSGLFILTLDHMPTGCGVWPAFWMYGEDPQHPWPTWGEFDIIEGVHHASRTMTTLHTTPSCNQRNVKAGEHFLGQWLQNKGRDADNCDVNAEGQWENQGCSQQGPEGSFGPAFNENGGGTFAAEWDPEARHFRTWFWPASQGVPADVSEQRPKPDTWGKPYSYFRISDAECSREHFKNMRLVFDITFCGDFGSPTFQAGCPAVGNTMTCEEFVERHPEEFKEAYWSIRGLDVYQAGPGGLQMPVEEAGNINIVSPPMVAAPTPTPPASTPVVAEQVVVPPAVVAAPAPTPVAPDQVEGLVPLRDAVLPLGGESVSSGYGTYQGQMNFAQTVPAPEDAQGTWAASGQMTTTVAPSGYGTYQGQMNFAQTVPAPEDAQGTWAAPTSWSSLGASTEQGFAASGQMTTTVAPSGYFDQQYVPNIAMRFSSDVHVHIARLPSGRAPLWIAGCLATVVAVTLLAGAWRRGALSRSHRQPAATEAGACRLKSSGYQEVLAGSAPEPVAEVALAEP